MSNLEYLGWHLEKAKLQTEIERLRGALDEIKCAAFYHMTRHTDERGDRKILGEIKERAITALKD